jgi:hypothetical protein
MSDEDTLAVISALNPLSTQFANLVNTIRDKKPVFDSISLVTPLVKNDLLQFCPRFESFTTCLVSICPSDYAEEMEETIYIGENACNVVVPLFN